MCNACGFPARPGVWTEAGAETAMDKMRAQLMQGAVINRLLRPHGLVASDGGTVPGIQLSTMTGATTIVDDLPMLWEEVERQLGHPLDPLAD
ncbi:hypothetical protein [Pseudodonghicola xiamenensis]|uniref:Uncharacterized protein n=1 Tax=Pseudodonghicola xiamenensis TaxID=337702 RepID=A0A8J3MGU4_9RHOB|nr:hypothetical protein [Pseudodonghicola xiamenensis]GHH02533.1 hypothetical protein GCM10010961_40360 [Pseudodonghicola xiamenensis]